MYNCRRLWNSSQFTSNLSRVHMSNSYSYVQSDREIRLVDVVHEIRTKSISSTRSGCAAGAGALGKADFSTVPFDLHQAHVYAPQPAYRCSRPASERAATTKGPPNLLPGMHRLQIPPGVAPNVYYIKHSYKLSPSCHVYIPSENEIKPPRSLAHRNQGAGARNSLQPTLHCDLYKIGIRL